MLAGVASCQPALLEIGKRPFHGARYAENKGRRIGDHGKAEPRQLVGRQNRRTPAAHDHVGDLLEPPANRPTRFWRGYDVYDQARAGFISDGPDARRLGTLLDVTQPGNGNGGHTYGTTLSVDQKRALLEYLKTR